MRETERVTRKVDGWGIVLSVLLHGLLCLFLFFIGSPAKNSALQEDSISVEIVTSPVDNIQQKPAHPSASAGDLPTPPAQPIMSQPPDPEVNPAVAPPKASPRKSEPKFVKPSQMLSEDVLADYRSNQAREELKQLAPADQIEQLCNLEAMAQVGAWNKDLKPDRVVAYAMADPKLSGSDFIAKGAAVHSERDWYSIQFKCQLAPDRKKVVAFEFLLGASIPKDIWLEHNLPDEDGELD